MEYTATYSPDDNKLRLYAQSRLDPETYKTVRAHGFIWAPKQQLFVAPMWTPEREDFLIELAGEIGDEDKGLIDRAEERAERFEDYSDHRAQDAQQAEKSVSAIADGIPFGQPILVGHHSEKRARRDAKKIQNGMDRVVKMWEQSQYWEQRAKSAIQHAKYKELPAVRARRIKGLEADKRKHERAKKESENLYKFWNGELFAHHNKTGEKKQILINQDNRAFIHELLGRMSASGVSIRGIDGEGWYSAYEILKPDEERYKNCPTKTVEELRDIALRLQSKSIAHCQRWINHIENRLTYEKAMLGEAGGIASDKTKPEKGGACKCWASHRGAWSYIEKVNKVTVTVLDNWGNGGGNFTRNIPFDKISALMTAQEVKDAKGAGTLFETTDKTGFVLASQENAEKIAKETRGETNQRIHEEAVKEQEATAERDAHIEQVRRTAKAGVQIVVADELFVTPPELAERMVEEAEIETRHIVLEPSAGTGNILKAIGNSYHKTAIEINPDIVRILMCGGAGSDCYIINDDFLSMNGNLENFDKILMNPPFSADVEHVLHAFAHLKDGGRIVAIMSEHAFFANDKRSVAFREFMDYHDVTSQKLPEATFKTSGTLVNARIVIINK